MSDNEELRRLMKAAPPTPYDWEYYNTLGSERPVALSTENGDDVIVATSDDGYVFVAGSEAAFEYIVAACNALPQLLDALAAAEQREAALQKERDALVSNETKWPNNLEFEQALRMANYSDSQMNYETARVLRSLVNRFKLKIVECEGAMSQLLDVQQDCIATTKEKAALTAENQRLKEALEYYADPHSRAGSVARAALAKKEPSDAH